MKKPRYLYHGSSNRNLKVLKPRKESFRDEKEGPIVFATPEMSYASCFFVNTSDSWVKISRWSDDPNKKGPWYFICGDKERFMREDRGGVIYLLPSEGFKTDQDKGTGLAEWVSKNSVTPITKTVYESALEAMITNGVQVIFTDRETMKKIEESDDHGWKIVSKLKTENERVG